ncbi:hypothetical protein EBR43_11400, partial [bacterium]|nr:hypothetical protein [bacterium]
MCVNTAAVLSTSPPFLRPKITILVDFKSRIKDVFVTLNTHLFKKCGKNSSLLSFNTKYVVVKFIFYLKIPCGHWPLFATFFNKCNIFKSLNHYFLCFILATKCHIDHPLQPDDHLDDTYKCFVALGWFYVLHLNFDKCFKTNHKSFAFHIILSILNLHYFTKDYLQRCGDVQLNPGPSGKLTIGTFNSSGCKNYSKLKRLMTWLFKLKKSDRFIYSLQETHISSSEVALVQSLWREGLIVSPSNGKARGVLTVFSNNLFDNILYEHGSKDGRTTCIIGSYNGVTDMFLSLYSPNSGKNAEFYSSFFARTNNLVTKYNVSNVYISGDFNLILKGGSSCNRVQTAYEKKLVNIVESELKGLGLECLSNTSSSTWNRGNKFSTLDYIYGPKYVSDSGVDCKILWGVDKSDHAAIQVNIEYDLDKGRGMFRPNVAFLDCTNLRSSFESELSLLMQQTDPTWCPHTKLEFAKVAIRSKVIEYSLKFKKQTEDKHQNIIVELGKLREIKMKQLASGSSSTTDGLNMLDFDIAELERDLDKVLSDKTKMLAAKSRVKWLELGEKSNKYFLNLNKSFQNSSYFKSFIVNGKECHDSKSKLDGVYDFYSKLYSHQKNNDSKSFLNTLEFSHICPADSDNLIKPLTKDELTKVLKSCGDTASGPDGIGYKLLKSCWSFYADVLLDSWNHGIMIGQLAPSHRESAICLLKKKGKDHKYIGNLRPITLSNCDIKLITKALTKRCNPILNKILNPHQTAYIPG